VSAVTTVRRSLERISATDARVNAFTAVLAERATAQAQRIDRQGADGPLAGVPFAVKNLFDVAGLATLAGSKIEAGRAPAARRSLDRHLGLAHQARELLGLGAHLRGHGLAGAGHRLGVRAAADRGVAVVGICNGFQVLTESKMLPGALLRNEKLKYVCKPVALEVTNAQTRFTAGYGGRREVEMTVGNGEGNYFADEETLDRLEGEGQVVFRYLDNPNGSARDIAGIVNQAGNVLGLMPHPDRAFDADLGSEDGAILFRGIFASA